VNPLHRGSKVRSPAIYLCKKAGAVKHTIRLTIVLKAWGFACPLIDTRTVPGHSTCNICFIIDKLIVRAMRV
jgi:hypothetical protein